MSIDAERYEQDFYRWTREQAALLKAGRFDDLDLTNLVEEITALGVSERRALGSHLKNVVMRLPERQYQPGGSQTSGSWRSRIVSARDVLLGDSPSLQAEVPTLLARRYRGARTLPQDQTGLPLTTFPHSCPWSVEQVLDQDFWPGEDSTPGAR